MNWYLVGEFFLSEWIWSITYGIYHVPVSMLIMFIIMRLIARMSLIPCLVTPIVAHIFSTLLFHFGIIGILITLLNFTYQHPYESPGAVAPVIYANIYLAIIHMFLHAIFFFIAGLWYGYRFSIRMTVIACLSNIASALLVGIFLPEL